MQLALSIEQACAASGLGRTKLYEAINSGALRARKLGKRTLILQSDMEAFLTSLENYASPLKSPTSNSGEEDEEIGYEE